MVLIVDPTVILAIALSELGPFVKTKRHLSSKCPSDIIVVSYGNSSYYVNFIQLIYCELIQLVFLAEYETFYWKSVAFHKNV